MASLEYVTRREEELREENIRLRQQLANKLSNAERRHCEEISQLKGDIERDKTAYVEDIDRARKDADERSDRDQLDYESKKKRLEQNVILLLLWVRSKIEEHDIYCEYDEEDWILCIENIIRLLASEFEYGYDYEPQYRFATISMEKLLEEVKEKSEFIPNPDSIERRLRHTLFGDKYPAIY